MEAHKEAKEAEKAAAEAEAEANEPRAYVDSYGPSSPVKRARIDATADQQEAANAYWDILRSGDWGEDDEKIDAAWDAMIAAFEGNEKEFDRLDEWLDKIMEEYSSAQDESDFNADNWMDLPSTWWQEPITVKDENGVTSSDLQSFRSLPASMQTAVQNGAASGVSGIKVTLDGYTVGTLVAPYVSQIIARDIA